jgi:uncharacterized protein YdaU (DUF1376 family)
MAKDPALLFYTSDFLTGTMFLSNEQIGKYIRLLCAQHQKGRLEEKDMLNVCLTYDKHVFSKFIVDEDGFYYNKRMEEEALKRKNYSDSRRKNREGKTKEHMKNTCLSYVKHMENVNEDVNTIPSIEEYIKYAKEKKVNVDIESVRFKYQSWVENGWKDGNDKPVRNWKTKLLNTLPYLKERIVKKHTIQL